MNNRSQRASIAKDTLDVIKRGFYFNEQGESQHIGYLLSEAVEGTIDIAEDTFDEISQKVNSIIPESNNNKTTFEITSESSLEAAHRVVAIEATNSVTCLNFASAKNPGGGFLSGSQAQEETLARSSGLYPCISKNMVMYEYNRSRKTCLYSDHMKFSPKVPVFRKDNGDFLDRPYLISFITSPAVNSGALKGSDKLKQHEIMHKRIEKMLSLALFQKQSTLILGAWGCGVFRNSPDNIANYFADHLLKGKFKGVFDRIIFAIYGDNSAILKPFDSVFSNSQRGN